MPPVRSDSTPRLHVREQSLIAQRLNDPDNAEARLTPGRKLRCKCRAEVEVERLCEPEADIRLVGCPNAAADCERRRLEACAVTRKGDQLERLAEVEGI